MTWFLAIVVVLLMGGVALVAAGRGGPMVEEYDDRPDALVPATGDLEARHLRRVRLSVAVRGYRMSEVDALLARLADQLDAQRAWQPDAERTPALLDETPETPRTSETPQGPAVRREDDVPPG